MSNFLKAAASYYGLAEAAARKTEVFTDERGTVVLVAEIAISDEDMAGIAGRMKAMYEAESEPIHVHVEVPSDARMRDEYNAMDKVSRSTYGSFSRYKAWRLGVAMDEQMAGAVDEEPVRVSDVVPPYVYLSPAEATPQQKAMAVGMDEKGNYAVALEDLTEEQLAARTVHDVVVTSTTVWPEDPVPVSMIRGLPEQQSKINEAMGVPADVLRADYITRTVAAVDRLNGADGKPTSNADDFGGVPG